MVMPLIFAGFIGILGLSPASAWRASLFVAGAITPHAGIFTQFTYSAADGAIGIDNVDARWAKHTMVAEKDLLFGLTLNNNPTVQDVWNTAPAWRHTSRRPTKTTMAA